LRLDGFERGEVFVEAAFFAFELFVAVGLEIVADLREPVASEIRGKTPRTTVQPVFRID